jgi:DNA polymerase III gamma/tau subunit
MFEELNSKQPIVVDFFRKCLENSKLARAYLFTGNAKSDKLAFIKELNKILNCERNSDLFSEKLSDQGIDNSLFAGLADAGLGTARLEKKYSFLPACHECQNCKWIEMDEHPKTPIVLKSNYEIDKDKKNKRSILNESEEDEKSKKDKARKKDIIPIKSVEKLCSSLVNSSESFRIVIIDNASYAVLEKEAANSLLKTIEEAKLRTMFILLADSKDTVLPTISSRCQIVNFNSNETKEYSEKVLLIMEELISKIRSENFSNKLEQLFAAEKLAEHEAEDLIQMLCLFQDEITNNIEADYIKQSDLIIEIENAVKDLKAFVRPKAVLTDLFAKI